MHITKWKKPVRKSNTYRMIPIIRHLRKGESVGKVKRSLVARGSGGVRGEQDWWNVADFSRAVKLPCKILRWRIWDTEHLLKPEELYSIDAFVAVVRSLSHVWLFATPWTAACQASLSFTISQRLLKLMSIESVPSPHYPAVWLLGIYLDKTIIQKDTHTLLFIAALFTIAKT